jgi:hypothetical protein
MIFLKKIFTRNINNPDKPIFTRNVYYSDKPIINKNCNDWALFLIIDKDPGKQINQFMDDCIKNNVLHISISGPKHNEYHLKFDEKVWEYELKLKKDNIILTTSKRHIKKELEWIIYYAGHPDHVIKNTICYDLSKKNHLKDIKRMLEEFDKEHNS